MSNPLGLDIGGANIKASDGLGCSVSREFAIWKQPDQLVPVLKEVLSTFPNAPVIAATMTAELADCFATKSEGVTTIVDALVASASGRRIRFWQTVGEFVDPDDAKEFWSLTAASNWHALSTWAGRLAPSGCTVLIDVGSTTCDIIPIEYGLPQPQGRTDGERLRSGELLYTGVKRTPICALSRKVMWNGEQVPLAAELFATSRDVYLITGELPERPDERDTADGRPATRDAAFQRLARMLCCDQTEVTDAELVAVARSLAATQHSHVASSIGRVLARLPEPPASLLLAGEGEFLASASLELLNHNTSASPVLSLTNTLGPSHSQAACAYALAQLLREREPFWLTQSSPPRTTE